MQVKIKYTTYKQHLVSCKDSSLNDCIKNLYSDESSDSEDDMPPLEEAQ